MEKLKHITMHFIGSIKNFEHATFVVFYYPLHCLPNLCTGGPTCTRPYRREVCVYCTLQKKIHLQLLI